MGKYTIRTKSKLGEKERELGETDKSETVSGKDPDGNLEMGEFAIRGPRRLDNESARFQFSF